MGFYARVIFALGINCQGAPVDTLEHNNQLRKPYVFQLLWIVATNQKDVPT